MIILKVEPENYEKESTKLKKISLIVKNGGLVAFPTETVYGIAVNAENKNAVKKLSAIKKRPKNKPYTYHFGSFEDFLKFEQNGCPKKVLKFIKKIMPAPITIIYYDKNRNKKIGIRIPENKIAGYFLTNCKCPVFAPSANPSGFPSPTSAQDVLNYFGENELDAVIDAGKCKLGKSSTIVEFENEEIKIIRKGCFKEKDIYNLLKKL